MSWTIAAVVFLYLHRYSSRPALLILSGKDAGAEQLPRRLTLNLRRIYRNSLEDRCVNRPRQRPEITMLGLRRKEHLQRLIVTKSDTCAPLWGWLAGRSIDTADTVACQGWLRTVVTTQIWHSAVGLTTLLAAAVSSSALVTTIRIVIAVTVATAAVIATDMPMMRRLECS
jgi:hypothetical protein